ncbi:ABC transporter substrate-binding protein [Paracoccus sp. R12_1]|uniref:ABC transporter substrate-binding protein n=1 Tax=unclassified Paracoccus (in: a-proteobacteria) TaxID=2688777 RepID=UPI001ADA7245|nr:MULTISPECIES: ABC transporter substrate-binding protein [unclassified Paracoccus (in: a-proteobacteria)]MBO9455299.1 ABC transporter substrate-binding protein [Paracoccus sp. R12_2]MBO9488182.1 ABC transporter substrate-binding protein [Paracoccus sp. R12_1]
MNRITLTALFAMAAPAAMAAPTEYPLTIDNCGHTLTFSARPDNVVSIGQATTEILYALGQADRLAGTALWFNAVLPDYEDENERVERISDNMPSFEAVVAKRPGFVPTMFEWMIGEQGAVGTREQFADLGIPAYVMPADCESKDNLVGADGTRLAPFDIQTVWDSIDQMAQVMDAQDAGDALIADLKARETAVVERAAAMNLPDASAAVWFSSADLELDPYMAGAMGIPAWMLERLGLRNVVTSDEEWPTVGWETIARADPSVIVIARMDRRRFPADDYDEKLRFLKSDPVTSQMTAVKQDRIVILDAEAMHASIRLIDGLEVLAEGMDRLSK